MKVTLQSIAERLEPVRSYLAIDGGDLELIGLSSDGKRLYIRLLGSCKTCDLNTTTIQLGILEPLRQHFPSIEAVEIVSD
ncbi:MAG: NifU family protein [Bacteroidia bacterium]|nr:NifU family protein [Bacteroidia bacterium]